MWRLLSSRKNDSDQSALDAFKPSQSRRAEGDRKQHSSRPRPLSLRIANEIMQPILRRSSSLQTWKSQSSSDCSSLNSMSTTSEYERCSISSSTGRSSRTRPHFSARYFKTLPREVYECIITQLEQIHLSRDQACPPCYLRDLYSLSLTSRAWYKLAAALMYGKVLVCSINERAEQHKLWVRGTGRLKLLRRTLRNRDMLAKNVRELHLSGFKGLYERASIEREEIVHLVASLVMECPNLERLIGFEIPFHHSFDRLSHALSTRQKLKERVWVLGDAGATFSDGDDEELSAYYHPARNVTESFLSFNSENSMLSTFVLHQEPGQSSAPLNFRAIIGTIHQFPALRHLSLSGLDTTSFPNLALNSLPPNLQSLRLENLPGINDRGLQHFARSQLATSIEKLTLINLGITSLTTLSTILSSRLAKLKHLSFVQYQAPNECDDISLADFHSSSLQYLHWEIQSQADHSPNLFSRSMPWPANYTLSPPSSQGFPFPRPGPECCLATSILAANIEEGAFPSLRRIRIPHDPQGVIQSLCRPLTTALLPSDALRLQSISSRIKWSNDSSMYSDHGGASSPTVHSFPSMVPLLSPRADSVVGTPTSPKCFEWDMLTPMRSRLTAQSRIVAARKETFITFRVYDSQGELRLEKCSAGFVGQIGSKITYALRADGNKGSTVTRDEDLDRSEWIAATDEILYPESSENMGGERKRGNCGHHSGGKSRKNMASIGETFWC